MYSAARLPLVGGSIVVDVDLDHLPALAGGQLAARLLLPVDTETLTVGAATDPQVDDSIPRSSSHG